MKIQHAILALSLSFTATAGLYQGGEEKKAEEVYKNIKTLKGMPASEVIPSMKFICASLKVDCEFCHKEDDFADDSIRAKDAARHMIEMQKDINTKNFNGRTQVTCNTCHNGSPNPQRVPALEGISRRTINRNAPAMTPADVLKKFATASGEIKAVTLEGTLKGLTPSSETVKVTQGGANKFVIDSPGRKFGFDGTVTWMQNGTQSFPMPPEQAVEVQKFGRFFRGEHAFDSYGELRFAGADKVAGKDVAVLRAGAQNAKVSTDLYFDSGTGLLTRLVSYTQTPLGAIPEFVDFSDYRKVGDAMVPFKITRTGGKEPIVFQFEKATANPTLDASFFSLPKGSQ